jgi:PKD repeat protein
LILKKDTETKCQIRSFIALAISIMFFILPFTSVVEAGSATYYHGTFNYTVNKTVTDVAGLGPGGNVTKAGDVIQYQITVNNSGNSLDNVTVNDTLLNLYNESNLPQDSNETLYGNYTVTQADIDNNGTIGNGSIINNVTVDCPRGEPINATVQTPIIQNANCSIVKTVTDVGGQGPKGNVTAAKETISYQINVTNTGNVDLTNVTVTDPKLNTPINVTYPVLGVGNSTTLNETYTVSQTDMDNNGTIGNGFILNNATVVSTQLGPENATVQTLIKQNANCTIMKNVTDVYGQGPEGNVTAANETISYEINVNNTGNVDLTNVTVTDPMLGILNTTNLGVGRNETIYGNYTVTQTDLDNNGTFGDGFITNNASVISDQLGPENDTATVPIAYNPICSIVKSVVNPDANGDCILNHNEDTVPYSIVVTNEGNIDLTNVTISDTLIPSLTGPTGDNNNDSVLNPGEVWVYNGTYVLTQDDVDNGFVTNTATVTSDQLPENSTSLETPVLNNKDLQIYKSITGIDEAGNHIIDTAGDIINYQVAIKNTGNVKLTGVKVDDPMITLTPTTGENTDLGILNPGEELVYTGDYTVTQSDIDNAISGNATTITNTATVSCNELQDESSSIDVPITIESNIVNTVSTTNPLIADFSTDVTSGYAPLTVQFTDKSQNAVGWNWDFGDGTTSTQENQSHVYSAAGTYNVNLTVSNANGDTNSKTSTINVLQPTTTSSNSGGNSGGSSGGSIGSATVVSSSSTVNTTATPNVTPTQTSTPVPEQTVTSTSVQTPEPTNTSIPAKQKSPGFELIGGIIGLLGAVYLYRRR